MYEPEGRLTVAFGIEADKENALNTPLGSEYKSWYGTVRMALMRVWKSASADGFGNIVAGSFFVPMVG
jgi:hypothetical protein